MKKKLTALLVGAALMLATGSAWALPILKLESFNTSNVSTASVVVIDGQVGDFLIGSGSVGFAGTVGNWILNVTTGLVGFNPGTPSMILNSSSNSIPGGKLVITFSDIITNAWTGNGGVLHAGGTLAGGTGSSVTFDTKINGVSVSNMPFSTLGDYSGSDQFLFTPTGNDSIEMIATLIHGAAGGSTLGYELSAVPEPGTMALLGFGLLGLAVYGKRRMNKES